MIRAALMTAAIVAAFTVPAAAQSPDELKQQLEAQQAINEQLRRRVRELEARLAGEPVEPVLRTSEPPPDLIDPTGVEAASAIEEALVSRGFALLPSGTFRVAPGVSWTHTGDDTLSADLTLQVGMPATTMLTANVPYVYSKTSIGTNRGPGDWSVGLSKQLNHPRERAPLYVASISYLHDSGDDPFGPVPLGFGFPAISGTFGAVKRISPAAVYGSLTYFHPFERDITANDFVGRAAPGASWGYRFGASLAATPEVTLDAWLSGAVIRGTRFNPTAADSFTAPRATLGFVNFGTGVLLGPRLSMIVSAAVGVTDDSPDYVVSLSLPYRF